MINNRNVSDSSNFQNLSTDVDLTTSLKIISVKEATPNKPKFRRKTKRLAIPKSIIEAIRIYLPESIFKLIDFTDANSFFTVLHEHKIRSIFRFRRLFPKVFKNILDFDSKLIEVNPIEEAIQNIEDVANNNQDEVLTDHEEEPKTQENISPDLTKEETNLQDEIFSNIAEDSQLQDSPRSEAHKAIEKYSCIISGCESSSKSGAIYCSDSGEHFICQI